MAKRLTDNLNSAYIKAASSLSSKQARERVVAYVESYDDVLFWRLVLKKFENKDRYIEVMLPSNQVLERGKKSVLMNTLKNNVGRNLIACVDADYDYLLQDTTETSRYINSSPYVFHTYVYAIENYHCYAPQLHETCVMATLNDHAVFPFTDFLEAYSRAIFPLFVWSLWHYRHSIYGQFTITDFNSIIDLGKVGLSSWQQSIDNLRRKVQKKISRLQEVNPEAKKSFLELKGELLSLGVRPEETYLYVQGHHLFDKVVLPIMNRVCSYLIQERETEIRRQAVHNTQLRNELSCYDHSLQDVGQMMKKNMSYMLSEPFKRVEEDLRRFFEEKQ